MLIGLVNSLELTPIAESMKKTEEEDISNIKTALRKWEDNPQTKMKCVQKICPKDQLSEKIWGILKTQQEKSNSQKVWTKILSEEIHMTNRNRKTV